MKTMVLVKNLVKSFGSNEIIRNCNMTIRSGTIYGFLGANGAGKTTVLKLISGLLNPTAGRIEIDGINSVNNREQVLKNVGSLIEVPIFYEHLSAKENMEIHLAYMNMESSDIVGTLKQVGLDGVANQKVSEFSLGMRQRLGIARAIIHKPMLLLLDEPINGLDPMGIKDMRELFLSLAHDNGMTIIIASHILSEIEHIADTIGVIASGTVVQEVSLSSIKATYPKKMEDYFLNVMSGGNKHD